MEVIWIILVSVLVLFLTLAVLLFILPTALHQNHTGKLASVKLAAHRGGAGERIENTMAAFDHSIQVGAHMLEIDVQETSDGIIVVSHDNDLTRVSKSSSRNKISEILYEDLPSYSNNLHLQFDRVACVSQQTDFTFVKLDDLFEKHKDVIIHIDTKDGKGSLINSVSNLIMKHNRLRNTVWGNMKEAKNKLSYAVNPNIHMFMSIRKVVLTYIMFYLGLIGFYPIKEAVFDIPMPSAIMQQFGDVLSTKQKVLGHLANFFMMNRLLFWHLRRRGVKVILFVLNRPTDFAVASKYGVDGIMTDFPTRLAKCYDEGCRGRGSERETSQILGDCQE